MAINLYVLIIDPGITFNFEEKELHINLENVTGSIQMTTHSKFHEGRAEVKHSNSVAKSKLNPEFDKISNKFPDEIISIANKDNKIRSATTKEIESTKFISTKLRKRLRNDSDVGEDLYNNSFTEKNCTEMNNKDEATSMPSSLIDKVEEKVF